MLHLSRHVRSPGDLDAFLLEPGLSRSASEARSILVQVFWNSPDAGTTDSVVAAVKRRIPSAVVVGARSSGQVSEGILVQNGMVVSVSCFSHATIEPFFLEVEPGLEMEAGTDLGRSLSRRADLRAALLLATPLGFDVCAMLRGMRGADPALLVFGGGTTEGPAGEPSLFLDGKSSSRGAVAVGLYGQELHIETGVLFDWKPLGPAIELTDAGNGYIRRIDGRPAFEHYRRTLGIEDRNDLYLLEFPLLVEREGCPIARNTISADDAGNIRIGADAYSGETARLGYLDLAALGTNVNGLAASLRGFRPEGIYLYSCVCRLFTLQEETAMEILPFQELAPTSGVYTSGEFYRSGKETAFLNSSEVVVALREGPARAVAETAEGQAPHPSNLIRERHARMTSHLFRFIATLTASLGEEVAERRRAEEKAQAIATEKERLLRELQHRVKNSMAMISSIASIESQRSETDEARKALQKLETRIRALASLYDLLYVTGSIEEIELADYLGRVVASAAEGLGADARDIVMDCRIDSARIDVRRAVSLGLVVNELVTDCLKYAFPDGRKGRIRVRLARDGNGLVLLVEDDGIGLAQGSCAAQDAGFGLTLVRSLAAQLQAEFSIRDDNGVHFGLRMPY